jgi:predicted GNAT family N-acyltransferase
MEVGECAVSIITGIRDDRVMNAVLSQAASEEDMQAAKDVRRRVFVEEQGVPPEIEMDEYDEGAIHVLCSVGVEVVGTGRLVLMPDGMKLGRVAVLPRHRAAGLGTMIVMWLLDRAAQQGCGRVYANVQVGARAFYERLGFAAVGETFTEAGIEHVRMERRAGPGS